MYVYVYVKVRVLNLCFPLKDGKEGWEANLFLCRLTLSFQTLPLPEALTISSVCLPPSLPPVPPLLLLYTLCLCLALCQSGYLLGLLCISVGERQICSRGGGAEIHPRLSASPRLQKLFFRKGQRVRKDRLKLKPQAGSRRRLAQPCEKEAFPFPLCSLSGTEWERRTLCPAQLAEHQATSCLLVQEEAERKCLQRAKETGRMRACEGMNNTPS